MLEHAKKKFSTRAARKKWFSRTAKTIDIRRKWIGFLLFLNGIYLIFIVVSIQVMLEHAKKKFFTRAARKKWFSRKAKTIDVRRKWIGFLLFLNDIYAIFIVVSIQVMLEHSKKYVFTRA